MKRSSTFSTLTDLTGGKIIRPARQNAIRKALQDVIQGASAGGRKAEGKAEGQGRKARPTAKAQPPGGPQCARGARRSA